ncbi:amino acid transporter [Microbacterium binotii]|uniref:amino acid transporter n=1 Tax=Microbacterium binotii TaxID=462710 RepID=UPI001F16D535|nr:amino acid transporter [Microbacterium binotii]UIN30565.1 amino acid transporter [Microbacterium binotii]
MTDKPTRRDIMKPAQLIGLALAAALFAGIVTLISMGFFQNRVAGQSGHALMVGGIVAGITFIATLVIIALLMLAVDPAQVNRTVDRAVLLPKEESEDASGDGPASDSADGDTPPRA